MKIRTTESFLFPLICTAFFSFDARCQSQQNSALHVETSNVGKAVAQMDSIQAPNGVFVVVDVPPQFPGGSEKMVRYITQNARLPTDPLPKTNGGEVLLQFIVEKDGSLSDIKVIQGIQANYDKECERLFSTMPKWHPGKIGKHLVRTLIMVPLRFS
jgi:protein TonB